MVATVREVLVFVASPGDCDPERQRVREVADDINNSLGPTFGLMLRVVGWEQVPPDLGRPQDQINPLVDDCDVFVGLLGYRWGSPTGTHDSGFHEEFERVRERRGDGDQPRVALFFKTIGKDRGDDPGPQLQAVLDFRARVQREWIALYKSFDSVDDLSYQLVRLFTDVLTRLGSALPAAAAQRSSADAAAGESAADEFAGATIDEARQQIAQTTDAVTRLARHGSSDDTDTDRLLLIALALNPDGGYLPVHVANRLFVRRRELNLSVMEVDLWRDSLLADVGRSANTATRTIPGFEIAALDDAQLVAATKHEDASVAVGAFRVLEQARRRPRRQRDMTANELENLARLWAEWLGRSHVADAAMNYLASVAVETDITLLDAILRQVPHDSLAALRALLADDPSPAAQLLASTYRPQDWLTDAVSGNLSGVNDEGVTALVASRQVDDELALAAFGELGRRGSLDDKTLTAFLRRGDDALNAVIAAALHTGGSSLTAERLGLVKERLAAQRSPTVDLQPAILTLTSTVDQLLDLVANGVIAAWEALAWKRDPRLAERARLMFDTDAAELIQALESSEAWRDSNVLPFVRWQVRTVALRMIVMSSEVTDEDRGRFRREFQAKSRWGDAAMQLYLPIATSDDLDLLLSMLADAHGAFREDVIETIVRVAGTAGARAILKSAPDKPGAVAAVHALGEDPDVADELRDLLYAPHEELRIAALSELAKRLDTSHLENLLNTYPLEQRETYYYNVVAELDRLLYLPVGPGDTDDAA